MKEITTVKGSRSLGESIDILREGMSDLTADIRELYELDEDNYQMVKNLQTALDKTNNRINAVSRALLRHKGMTVLGVAVTGLVIWGIITACANDIKRLEAEIEELREKKEESDG